MRGEDSPHSPFVRIPENVPDGFARRVSGHWQFLLRVCC